MAFLSVAILAPAHAAEKHGERSVKQILVVYGDESTLPALMETQEGLLGILRDNPEYDCTVYVEYLDIVRFPSPRRERFLINELLEKYALTQFDAVVAVGPDAVRFLAANRRLVPGVPMIVGAIGKGTFNAIPASADVKGLVSRFDVLKTLELARRLQPQARKVVVLSGSGEFDRRWEDAARRELSAAGVKADYISGMTINQFEDAVRVLPSNSIVLVLSIYRDANGQRIIPAFAAQRIASASAAPVYSVYDTYIGKGTLGGFVEPFQDIGREMGLLALRSIEDPGSVPPVTHAQGRFVIDWRQLMRWHIPASNLPADTEVRYRELSIFERYRWQIYTVVAVLLFQAATIAALVMERRSRSKMRTELTEERLALEHMTRVSQLGEMSGAFAHELNQPLTSILANAESGLKLVSKHRIDTDEIENVLGDIVFDSKRASSIINQLRSLFRKGKTDFRVVDLNFVVDSVIRLTNSTFVTSGTKLMFIRSNSALPISADVVQLQHLVLNLVLNSMEAMTATEEGRRRILICTRLRDNRFRELSVEDNGAGLPREMLADAFRPFVTTKEGGLGLGLAICRTIVAAHRGTLAFDENRSVGARVVLTLPPPEETPYETGTSDISGR